MRTLLDFTPLSRSTIGFDRVFDKLENASRLQALDHWPPYDIIRMEEDAYRIVMAVAGFSRQELTLSQEPNLLVVSGAKSEEDDGEYLHRGIAGRAFQRRFELADYVKVTGASLENGLLTIDLAREIPEAMKPRRIEIRAGETLPKIESSPDKGLKQVA